jgi:hypothetical protein
VLSPGTTILIPSGPPDDPNRKHLHIVVARKSGPPIQILMVSVCSMVANYQDPATTFVGGEHPFIGHPSYTRYSVARVDHEADIQRGIDDGQFELHAACSQEMLDNVIGGFEHSRFAKPFTTKFIEDADD